ncbi:hypothetical protein K402DRAFT_421743 [Aulographum hederae CBS 113979]|uniref:Zn(2)-C6 fungal-type domain-containing protein n=1 Tax=Aulographum hederae CBS 113979 TaxID=1176131 RepID=A0A6G1GXX7_9PEZI|nr:hypothetical protein K402DRAFT_421743 [Aulographum hederae CBS 113979]
MSRGYRGRPSTGCASCRKSKVKCDETVPICKRCLKTGHDCVYRDSLELYFRNETGSAAKRAQDGWRQRSKKPTKDGKTESRESSTDVVSVSPISLSNDSKPTQLDFNSSLTILPMLAPSAIELSENRFFFDYVLQTNRAFPYSGIMDFLPELYRKSSQETCLPEALAAMAKLNLYRRTRNQQLAIQAAESYGHSLQLMKAALQNPETARSNEVLISMYLMGMYESISIPGTRKAFWNAHREACIHLLRHRGRPDRTDVISIRMVQMIYIQVLTFCMSTKQAPPPDVDAISEYFTGDLPIFKLMRILHDVAIVLNEIGNEELAGNAPERVMPLLTKAAEIDAQLGAWTESLPQHWKIQSHELNPRSLPKWLHPLFQSHGAPTVRHTYHDMPIAFSWNLHRTTRVLLNVTMIKTASHMLSRASTPESMTGGLPDFRPILLDNGTFYDVSASEEVIRNVVEYIVPSVITHLSMPLEGKPDPSEFSNVSRLRMTLLIWPLATSTLVMNGSLSGIDLHRRGPWLRQVLQFIKQDLL